MLTPSISLLDPSLISILSDQPLIFVTFIVAKLSLAATRLILYILSKRVTSKEGLSKEFKLTCFLSHPGVEEVLPKTALPVILLPTIPANKPIINATPITIHKELFLFIYIYPHLLSNL